MAFSCYVANPMEHPPTPFTRGIDNEAEQKNPCTEEAFASPHAGIRSDRAMRPSDIDYSIMLACLLACLLANVLFDISKYSFIYFVNSACKNK